jgi:hypothetical protein
MRMMAQKNGRQIAHCHRGSGDRHSLGNDSLDGLRKPWSSKSSSRSWIRCSMRIRMDIGPAGRPKQAIAVTRKRCWQFDWGVEFDIKGAFDHRSRALDVTVRSHIKERRGGPPLREPTPAEAATKGFQRCRRESASRRSAPRLLLRMSGFGWGPLSRRHSPCQSNRTRAFRSVMSPDQ